MAASKQRRNSKHQHQLLGKNCEGKLAVAKPSILLGGDPFDWIMGSAHTKGNSDQLLVLISSTRGLRKAKKYQFNV